MVRLHGPRHGPSLVGRLRLCTYLLDGESCISTTSISTFSSQPRRHLHRMTRPGARLSETDCDRIKAFLDDGTLSCTRIGVEIGVNRKTIERMKLSFELFRTPYPPALVRRGRPRALTTPQEDWLLGYLAGQPTAEAQELGLALFYEFGIRVSNGTIYRALKGRNWSRTAAKALAAQRSEQLIAVRNAKQASN